MKKVCLTVIGLYLLLLSAFSQAVNKDSVDTSSKEAPSSYASKPLKLDEINIVSSYYSQQGNHSAVTGGVGTETVTDMSNGLELKFAEGVVEISWAESIVFLGALSVTDDNPNIYRKYTDTD